MDEDIPTPDHNNLKKISKLTICICILLPTFLGYTNFLFNLAFDYHIEYYLVELLRNNIQLLVFFGIVVYLLKYDFYSKHYLGYIGNYKFCSQTIQQTKLKINTLIIYLILCLVVANSMIIWGNKIIMYLAIATIFGPVIEGLCAQSIFTVLNDKNKKFLTVVVILSSMSFSLMHYPYSELAPTADFLEHLQKYIQHFIYALYLNFAALYFKRIDISILLHAAQNASYFIWI